MKQEQETQEKMDFKTKQDLVEFFNLLLKIDKRNNPHLYQNNRNTNHTNKSPQRLSSDWEHSFR